LSQPALLTNVDKNMNDDVLGKLREARCLLLEERDSGKPSRELSIVLTEIDTAILWRQEDLRLKLPVLNECAPLT
jgi:hypothetical protein